VSDTIRARLQSLHRKVLLLDRVQHLSRLVGCLILCVAGAIGVDWLVRWPMMVRLVLLAIGLVLAVRAARAVIERCWIRKPSLTSTTLRLERVEPRLRESLTSALEFERRATSGTLEAQVVERALATLREIRVEHHVRSAGMFRWLAITALLVLTTAWWLRHEPQASWIGLRRTLTPWSADRWLPRVVIEPAWDAPAVARGSQVPFRVQVLRGDVPDLRVRALCTTWSEAGVRDEREIELVRQPDGSFERPIQAEGVRMSIQARAADGETEPLDIKVVTAPSIASGTLEIAPPAYAAGVRPVIRSDWKRVAIPDSGPILADSTLQLTLQLDAPALDPSRASTVRVRNASDTEIQEASAQAVSPTTWLVRTPLQLGMSIVIEPVDAAGVRAMESLRLQPQIVEDTPPVVSVVEPETDEIITSGARVPFRIMAKDDLRLASIGWTLDRQQRSGEPAPLQLRAEQVDASDVQASIERVLDVKSLQARSGDTLLLRGTTQDIHQDTQGSRAIIASEPRRLRVVDKDVLERQVRQQAGSLRETLARLETTQREVMQEKDPANRARTQGSLADRIRQANDSNDKLVERLKRNDINEIPLAETLQEAGRAMSEARDRAEQAQDLSSDTRTQDPSRERELQALQQETAERLAEAIDLLDRDDDAAAMQRRAERLAEAIQDLRESLQQASRGTAGKPQEELGSEARQALQEQANRQRATADEAAAMLEDLRDRANQSKESDPAQARSLQQAAEEGEKGQAARRLDEAAERTDRNQTVAADESLQRAAEAVEKVRESLRQDRRARTEELRRRLVSLSETIRALIQAGEATLPRIDAAAEDAGPETQAVGRELLRISTNTAAAGEDARQGDRSLATIAGSIVRASERFDAAATALARATPDFMEARNGVSRGIELLREAQQKVAEAQAKQDQAAADRERQQLAAQFQQLAMRIRASREGVASTLPAPGVRMDRKGAAIQREQSAVVGDVQRTLQSGPAASEVLNGAEVFQATITRIDKDLVVVRDALAKTTAGASEIRRMDLIAEGLEGLSAALTDPEPGEDPFADGKGEGQGGGAGGGAAGGGEQPKLPPIAELRLIRQMQAQVNRQTRILDEARGAGPSLDAELADLAVMQDDIRRLSESWFERMRQQQAAPKKGTSGAEPEGAVTPGFLWPQESQSPPTPSSQATPDPPSSTQGKTLDELLGISSSASSYDTAQRRRERKLESALQEKDLDDLATAAQESIALVDELVGDKRDIGVETQRAQAEALANIDALLDAATRFQRQQQASSSSSGSSRKRQQSQQNGSEQQAGAQTQQSKQAAAQQQAARAGDRQRGQPGDATGDASEPPSPEDPVAIDGVLEEGRIEWGALPQRVREIMSQARRDRVSALYQEATEAYYRRLAERRDP
jgi:hypothetical protein